VHLLDEKQKTARRRSVCHLVPLRSGEVQGPVLPPICNEAQTQEGENHHCPGCRFGHPLSFKQGKLVIRFDLLASR
jgi:hypothetical protein